MDKTSKIFLGLLFGAVVYGISEPATAVIYGTLTFIVIFLVTG